MFFKKKTNQAPAQSAAHLHPNYQGFNNNITNIVSMSSPNLLSSSNNTNAIPVQSPSSPTSSSPMSLIPTSPTSPWSANAALPAINTKPNSRSVSPNTNLGAKLVVGQQSISPRNPLQQQQMNTLIDENFIIKMIRDFCSKYTVVFEKCVNKGGDYLNVFRDFLSFERNLAPLEFIEAVSLYKDIEDNKKRYETARYIVENFVDDSLTSDKQVNLPNNLKDKIVTQFEDECTESDTPASLFDEASTDIHISLRNDNFARFVNSNNFLNYVVAMVKKEVPHVIHTSNSEDLKKFLQLFFSDIGFRNNRRSRVQSLSMTSSFSIPINYSRASRTLMPVQGSDQVISDTFSHSSTGSDQDEITNLKQRFEELLREDENKFIDERFFDIFYGLMLQEDLWEPITTSENHSCYISNRKFYSKVGSQPDQSNESLKKLESQMLNGIVGNKEVSTKKSTLQTTTSKINIAGGSFSLKKNNSQKKEESSKPRGAQLFKDVGLVHATTDDVLHAILDNRNANILNGNIQSKDIHFMEYIKANEEQKPLRTPMTPSAEAQAPTLNTSPVENEYSVTYSRYVNKMPYFLNSREFIIGTTVRKEINEDGTESSDYVIILKSINPKEIPVGKGLVRGQHLGGILIESAGVGLTRYSSVNFIDYGGSAGKKIRKKVFKEKSSNFYSGIKKILSKPSSKPMEDLSIHSQRAIDTLQDYLNKLRRIIVK